MTDDEVNLLLRSAHNNAIEDCIAVLRPALMQEEDMNRALIAGRWIEKMRLLKRHEGA